MPIVLFRLDERLIHGQVIVGWGGPLHADRVVVVDDGLADSAWEQELYCLGVPAEIEASFATVEEARRSLPAWRASSHRTIVLVRDVATLARVAEDGRLRDQPVNLGGVHDGSGRARVLPYLHLSRGEWETLREVEAQGAEVTARDLPASRAVPLDQLAPGG